MAVAIPDINKLPKCVKDITKSDEYIKYLPSISTKAKTKDEAECLLQHIVAVIEFEIFSKSQTDELNVANQVVLNTAYRAYFQLIQQHKLPNIHLNALPKPKLLYDEEVGFQLLYAMLLTDQHAQTFDPETILMDCTKALSDAINDDCASLLYIIKVLNILLCKFPKCNVNIPLQQIYYCLQTNQNGMREESLNLFSNCCRQIDYAFENFQVILEFWPWSNRFKFYLISCILKTHNLIEYLRSAHHSVSEFFAGVRLSLSHKSLLAASQYLVKALSAQNSDELLQLSTDILTRGSVKEIKNFYAQWNGRIEQKDRLFEFLQSQPEIVNFLENTIDGSIEQDYFRSTLIFSMFSRQIFEASKLHFFKISTELITNCFQLELETQMLIFKFIVDNLASFAIEDCLEFTAAFIKEHKCIENAQYRNEILGKMPAIVNYVSKTFSKLHYAGGITTLETSIHTFFKHMHLLIDDDIGSNIYQPKIFSLRLLEILLKSLYADNLEKNAKNCCLTQNKKLGKFLVEQKVFECGSVSAALFKLLDDPLGFDDALELIMRLLQQINFSEVGESVRLCKEFSRRCGVDECVLSTLYARVTLNCCKSTGDEEAISILLQFAITSLKEELEDFQQDPLLVCKTRNHLFGFINIVGEVVQGNICLKTETQNEILDLLEKVLNLVLDLLNVCKADPLQAASNAASFQDMEESLEILVQKSAYKVEDHGEFRKLLLMSFWLTLKATCDLATEIGMRYVATTEHDFTDCQILKRCLDINVTVLTRCRHKGAIEAAGVSIGKLTKSITSHCTTSSAVYHLLYNCLELLFDNTKQVSVTRRGAGYSIMMLHIVKNEQHRTRPLLKSVMDRTIALLKNYCATDASHVEKFDRLEALLLHYVGVLVRDTELREATSHYYNEILLVTLKRIEHPEWTEFNAALQLFGALIPKIVGQTMAKDFDAAAGNENNDITYDEIIRKLPTACDYILNYFASKQDLNTDTRTTVLFLGFLSKVKHLPKQIEANECSFLQRIRELMWHLLAHRCESVRKLAALCFVRAHDFRLELPQALISISNILGNVSNENLFLGFIATLAEGILRMQHESLHINDGAYKDFMQRLRSSLADLKLKNKYEPYSISKLLDIFLLVGFDAQVSIVQELLHAPTADEAAIGYDVWQQCAGKFMCKS
uniref:Thyroid adenoma-associated n=1 Tax=Bactrocera latifrons TaxID=174628 RepID=A0A0K8W3X0_BACLA